jgi:predicted O-linked N-acetylglucosamine transferase (SPINDLY family)
VIFGSFNSVLKLNASVFSLWRRILDAVPGSRMVIKNGLLDDPASKVLLTADLKAAGLTPERIELRGSTSYLENFASYNDIHIALDPFPFCGGLTSLDALWMGVPVVTLEQELMAGRQTLAFLHNIGHAELIAATPDDYVSIAVELARDPARIKHYRETLREAMRASPLLDHAALTRNLEVAYRQMWQRYCEQPKLRGSAPRDAG